MKKLFPLNKSRVRMLLLCVADIFCIMLNSILALAIRFDFHYTWIPLEYLGDVVKYMPINIITTIIIFIFLFLYRSVWSFASINELARIIGACVLSTAFQALGMQFLLLSVPRSYYVLYLFLLIATTTASRFSYRLYKTARREFRKLVDEKQTNTMIVGAGEAGSMILHEIKSTKTLNQTVRCIIDDNKSKHGKYLHGVLIVGGRDSILENAEKYHIDEIIIAIPSASSRDTKEIINLCNRTSCKLKILPGIYQLINEDIGVSKLREVSIEDLLGRDPIDIDLDSLNTHIRGKVILVTGGGGSIGSELCRQLAAYKPRQLIIFDIYENGAYDVQQELKKQYPDLDLKVLIGSVRNTSRIESVMERYRPDVVYHAAAHKHVPLMEDSPNEAIKNNVFGTYKTARAADKYGVKRFVLISTDKAVNPTNIMGATKRICEMIIQTFSKYSKTEYAAVRFGNVLGSNGSVIPLFKRQIAEGGPVTVTHPEILRYFMTIPEAVSLVLQAGAYANGGEIFVLDMGEPVRIADLAKNLIRLSGYTLGVDMEIVYIGLRPGEKLYEELLTKEEGLKKTDNELIYIGHPLIFNEVHFLSELKKLEQAAAEESLTVKRLVAELVPTYHIRPEDEKRDEALYAQFYKLGDKIAEKPAMSDQKRQEEHHA